MPWIPNRIGESTPGAGDGEIIQNEHMNVLRDAAIIQFSTVAERDTYWPAGTAPNGAHCVTVDTGTDWKMIGGAWRALYPDIAVNGYAAAVAVSHGAGAVWLDVLNVPVPVLPFASTLHIDAVAGFGFSGAVVNATPDITNFIGGTSPAPGLAQAPVGAWLYVPIIWSFTVAANADPSFTIRLNVSSATAGWYSAASCHYRRRTN